MPLASNDELLEAHQGMLMEGLAAIFGAFNQDMLRHVLPRVQWLQLGGGDVLFRQQDRDESLFFVISGRLRAVSVDEAGVRHVLGEITRGETVGEMAFFTGEPRTATVAAVRDSVLARFSNEVFRELLLAYPLVSLNMTRQLIARFQRVNQGRKPATRPVIIGVVAISADVDADAVAEVLAGQLASHGKTMVVSSRVMDGLLGDAGASQAALDQDERSQRVAVSLDRIEAQHQFVLFVADPGPTQWTQRCLRHSDELLLVADADQPPVHHANEAGIHGTGSQEAARKVLVLLHPDQRRSPIETRRWFEARKLSGHVHVRRDLARDWQRLGRVVSRNTVGLVLSGGGARGFAHLGVMRALEEAGIDFDLVAGTSIGAVMAAYAAMDLPMPEVIRAARHAFRGNPMADINLVPMISLVGGRRLRSIIDSAVVDSCGQHIDIEDLWKTYFCVSSNYSTAREAVHTRGHLARAVRASVSIPGALPPVMLGGELHIDGGTFNNFPTDVMDRLGAARIIGVDLLRDRGLRYELDEVPGSMELIRDRMRGSNSKYGLPSLTTLLLNTSMMYSYARQQESHALVDLHFAPGVGDFGMLDWAQFDRIVEVGYRHGLERLERVGADLVASFRTNPATPG